MKLYYKTGACSLASHVALIETGQSFEIEAVDTTTGITETGLPYAKINPKGYVPTLDLGDGEVLTEGPAILQFLADKSPSFGLAPKTGTIERARMNEQLTFISSELHKAFGPLFRPTATQKEKKDARAAVWQKLNLVEATLSDGRETVAAARYTIADIYLFVVVNWANFTEIDLGGWPNLQNFMSRIAQRPAVQAALRAEGLAS